MINKNFDFSVLFVVKYQYKFYIIISTILQIQLSHFSAAKQQYQQNSLLNNTNSHNYYQQIRFQNIQNRMISTFTSKLKTENLFQISVTESILTQNFLLIASQFDRLQNHHNMIHNNIFSKIQTIQKNLENRIKEVVTAQNSDQSKNLTQTQQNLDCNKTILVSQMKMHKQKMSNDKDKEPNFCLELQKQINKLVNQTNTMDLRLETLQKYINENVHRGNKDDTTLQIKKDDRKENKQNMETQNPSNKKIKKIQQEQKKINTRLEELQSEFKSKIKNAKKYFCNLNPKQTDSDIKKQQPVIDENSPNQNNELMELSQDQHQQFKKQVNFKFERIENQNIKNLKNIKQIQQEIQKHSESLYSVIQKIKTNQTNIDNQIKDIYLKFDKQNNKKKIRENISSILVDKLQTQTHGEQNLNQLDEQQKRIQEILEEIEALKGQVTEILKEKENMKKEKLNHSVTTNSSQPTVIKQKSNTKKIENLEHNVSVLKKDLNSLRYQLNLFLSKDQINAKLTQENKMRPIIHKQSDGKEQFKEIATKIQKMRAELMTFIKQLQLKLTEKEEQTQLLHELEQKIHQHKLLINKKADQFQSDRTMKKLQTRLNNFIKQSIAQQQYANTHDARIAKQPWFCLSCDNELKNYTGKQGKYLQKDILPGKKINPQNHMIRRSVKDLPEIK